VIACHTSRDEREDFSLPDRQFARTGFSRASPWLPRVPLNPPADALGALTRSETIVDGECKGMRSCFTPASQS
jgi:hypothetical protein